jgi:hypothetical protein
MTPSEKAAKEKAECFFEILKVLREDRLEQEAKRKKSVSKSQSYLSSRSALSWSLKKPAIVFS